MAKVARELRVHLDHLVRRQSIRYIPKDDKKDNSDLYSKPARDSDRDLRYDDIRRDDWFSLVRKPDFQRETNAWTPKDCVAFLDSVVSGRIIPSIILWRNNEDNSIYVLDGAHRLSVLRAWMSDDWGDKAGDYYVRRDESLIRDAALKTREEVQKEIGSFVEFLESWQEHKTIADNGGAPRKELSPRKFSQASFYSDIVGSYKTLYVQWEKGDYKSAEQSFLRINRSGQALDPWEATLIEHRQSSYARSIMSIANGGESGHYWPELKEDSEDDLVEAVKTFPEKAEKIHRILFVPPFRLPVISLSVPMMVAPEYFQKHKYLLEIIPILVDQEIAQEEQQIKIMKKDVYADPNVIIKEADRILSKTESNLEHFLSLEHSSKSLSIIPLFYWYNRQAKYARGLFYGFVFWLLSGSEEKVRERKLFLSANRDRFEHILFHLKSEIASLQEKGGAGLNATKRVATFLQKLFELFQEKPTLEVGSDELETEVISILTELARLPARRQKSSKTSRNYTRTDKSQINVRELFESSIRCHICGGIVNLHYGGLQYDHVEDYAESGVTDPDTGKPTHPFCNRHKKRILAHRIDHEYISLPSLEISQKTRKTPRNNRQLVLPGFWGSEDFPL